MSCVGLQTEIIDISHNDFKLRKMFYVNLNILKLIHSEICHFDASVLR